MFGFVSITMELDRGPDAPGSTRSAGLTSRIRPHRRDHAGSIASEQRRIGSIELHTGQCGHVDVRRTLEQAQEVDSEFQPRGATRLPPTKLLDLSAQKTFTFRGGKNRLKLMFDAFNVFNVNTILSYSSQTVGSATFNNPSSLVPPRVFRVGAQIVF